MPNNELDDAIVVPLTDETEAERRRIRESNDRDQQLEREGKRAAHNEGYDEVSDLGPPAEDIPQGRTVAQSVVPGTDINDQRRSAADTGDEAPGGDPAIDMNLVDEVGRAAGIEYQDDEPLRGADKVDARDKRRWN